MSIEYIDGSFSENMPINDALKKLKDAIDDGSARALHIGTEKELNAIKHRKSIEQELSDLKGRLEKLEEPPVESSTVVIPTRDEVIGLLREKNFGRAT